MKNRKNVIVILLLIVGFIFGPYLWVKIKEARAVTFDTHHTSWSLVRETGTEDGANFAAVYNLSGAEGDFANKDSATMKNGGPFHIVAVGNDRDHPEGKSPGTVWKFVIAAGAADGDTFSFNLIGWAKTNGMLQIIAEGNGVIGTQDVVLYPDDSAAATNVWWADTIVLDETTKWTSSANEGTLAVINSGDNEVAAIIVDLKGIEWVQFVFYDADSGQAGEADPITVFGRRY